MRQQARGPRQDGDRLRGGRREAEVEQHRRDRQRDVQRQRPAPRLGDRLPQRPSERDVRPAHAPRVRELEDALGARVDRRVDGVAEAGHLAAGGPDPADDVRGRAAGGDRLLEQPRAFLGGAEDDRARAEDPGGDGALQRAGVGGERHPRGDVRRHHPVLGDRDEEQVEEEALVLGRLLARQQQVEVLGERQPAHEVSGEVASAYLDPVRVGPADPADGIAAHLALRSSHR